MVYGQADLLDDGTQRSLCYFMNVRYCHSSVRRNILSEYDVTTALSVVIIPDFSQRLDDLTS